MEAAGPLDLAQKVLDVAAPHRFRGKHFCARHLSATGRARTEPFTGIAANGSLMIVKPLLCGLDAKGGVDMRNAVSFLVLAVALAAPTLASAQEANGDPWENFNRGLFAVHEGVDQAVVEPVARGYRAITPSPVRGGVRNFLRNLRSPVIFVNDVLQGELGRAGATAARFGVNTTIGVGGVLDPATSMGLERHDEDFGQTLAVWGVAPGPYLFIPLMGPSNVRDTLGRLVDSAFDPLTWAEGEDADEFRVARGVFTALSTREQLLEPVDDVRANSVDPYASFRGSYMQLRESAVQNGRTNVQDLPEFDDMESMSPEDDASEGGGPEVNFLSPDPALTLASVSVEQIAGDAQ